MSSEQGVVIPFRHKERGHPAQIHRRLEAQSGLETYNLRSVQHWCQLSDCGRQNLSDDQFHAKIPVCTKKEPFSPTSRLAEGLDVSPAIALDCLHNSLGVKIFIFHGSHTS
jgi:hypothetical protein